jgi:Flagellar biosynthesis protein, FliO
VSLAFLLRRPIELLPALGGAALMLLVLGPNLRGAAGATLAAAGAIAARLRGRGRGSAEVRALRVLEQLRLGPRVTLALIETAGRQYLLVTGATVTPLPPEQGP